MSKLPTVRELIDEMDRNPGDVDRCYHIHRDRPREALPELWFHNLGVWMRTDGWSYSGDCLRGYAYPNRFQAWLIRRAVRRWQEAKGGVEALSR